MSNKFAKQITKNQHIIPQRHLKNFTVSNNTRLECLNADAMRLEKTQSPESICSADFFYALDSGKEDEYSQIVEKDFGNIENWYGDNIDRIKDLLVSKQILSNSDKYAVSWIIVNFYFRGHKFKQGVKKLLDEVMDWIQPSVSKYIHKQCLRDYPKIFHGSSEEKKSLQATTKQFLSHQAKNTSHATSRAFDIKFVNMLTHKKWEILINNSVEFPFVTGDEAVIEITNNQIPKMFSNGFLALTHIFHLSPKIAIIASYPYNKEMHGQVVFEDVTKNKSEIFKNNLLYVSHTYKYCYASKKRFFEELINLRKNKKMVYEN